MIDEVKLKFGSEPGELPLAFDATPITVFVGPNNSGKSRVLTEIEARCRQAHGHRSSDAIIEAIQFAPFSNQEIEEELTKIERMSKPGEVVRTGHLLIGKIHPQTNQAFRAQIDKAALVREAKNPGKRRDHYCRFLDIYTVRMDGTNRLNMLNEQVAGDLQETALNHLTHLFHNNDARSEVRRIVHDAFGKHFVIDPTNIGKLRVRLSDVEPRSEREEKGWEEESVTFHGSAEEIKDAGDGIKAFAGVISTLLAGDPKIILLDEPEAFLHPALSNRLGIEIARSLRQTKKRLFVSTHSASFLMGCIQSGTAVNIVRLTYNNRIPTARLLPQAKLLRLMRHPLLRSTGILAGLFYEAVVVAESDSDRAFYQEINERLLAADDPRGIKSCLFVNAQNKQTVWEIVAPLRELGIPAVGIVDIDVLKEGGAVWKKPLEGAFIPSPSHQGFRSQRQAMKKAFENTGKDMKMDGGVCLLAGEEREACDNLLRQLSEYGVFVVAGGEAESWLRDLGASGHGPTWLVDIFEKMGEDPDDAAYVRPTGGDVWDFMGQVAGWAKDPKRKGVPK